MQNVGRQWELYKEANIYELLLPLQLRELLWLLNKAKHDSE